MPFTKEQIEQEIRRTAAANGGKPLGATRLAAEAGIGKTDWQRYWARLTDAHDELGFTKNEMQKAIPKDSLLDSYAGLARSLKRLPTKDDLAFKNRNDKAFPHATVFARRFGAKENLVRELEVHCGGRAAFEAVLQMCREYVPSKRKHADAAPVNAQNVLGYVYLIQHGKRREYKIGRTNNSLRREGEIAVELPEKVQPVHVIRTDDPAGIEAYWHKRFAHKRKNGEWFELNAADVATFKLRKFM